jgi:cell pole-organizing protein PopZ
MLTGLQLGGWFEAMSRADKVAAEPKMDDLLASIRRAIHDEGLDVAGAAPSEERDVERETAKTPRLASPSGRSLPPDGRRPAERSVEKRSEDSQEIAALRDKITRELNNDELASLRVVVPAPRTQPAAQPQSVFKSLLGGNAGHEPKPLITAADAQRPAPPKAEPAEPLEETGPQALGRPAVLPIAPRRPLPAQAARSAFDLPNRSGDTYRPPFGQGSLGIRGFQPPAREAADRMVSLETSTMTASSFNRLAEQMFGREGGERSIDDLARELLYPMLKQWLDQNLPRIVEQLVREEIERVARRGGR